MKNTLNIALAQLNFTVGDLSGNYKKISAAHKKANSQHADLAIFSELAITGYPPEDLLLRPTFQNKAMEMVRKLAPLTQNGTAILVGSPWFEGGQLYNAAILLDGGEIKHISCKSDLPNYGVFDEKRVFTSAPMPEPMDFRGMKLGVMVCEEMWNDNTARYLKKQGAEMLISINASPFEIGKNDLRLLMARQRVGEAALPLIYLNQIGGQDELVFDGNSFILSDNADVTASLVAFAEDIKLTKWHKTANKWQCEIDDIFTFQAGYAAIYSALKLGLRDYITKNNFPGVVLGMSGGIDSALSAAIAVDCLGAQHVRLVMMPSKYTSKESLADAASCAKMLSAHIETISIEKIVDSFSSNLEETFQGTKSDITEENLQSRIRGNILMALSNKFGNMVLTTGNKSEMAVGYATLYGDMCGGFNVLKDVYKTDIFALCKWRNLQSVVIPENIINKAPTAELKPNQTDQDTLPPYEILDKILHRLIELRQSVEEITRGGFEREIVIQVARMIKMAEYKRRQAAPGVKISQLAFGRDRRYPITNAFNF
jgi:NAD+ synthase